MNEFWDRYPRLAAHQYPGATDCPGLIPRCLYDVEPVDVQLVMLFDLLAIEKAACI